MAKPAQDQPLRQLLQALATQYPRYGYLTPHSLLKDEGLVINKKRTYRIYTEEGLQVRTKKRKKVTRPRMPMVIPIAKNIRWSMDFVSDQLSNVRRFQVFNIGDDYSREMICQLGETRQLRMKISSMLWCYSRGKVNFLMCHGTIPHENRSIDNQKNMPYIDNYWQKYALIDLDLIRRSKIFREKSLKLS